MRLARMTLAISALLAAASCQSAPTAEPSKPVVKNSQASDLLFADEFNAGQLDRSKWIVIGPDFWVNNEQQAYVDTPETIRLLPAGSVDGADGGAYPFKTNGIKEPYQGMPVATVERIKRGEVAMWVDWVRVYGSNPKR